MILGMSLSTFTTLHVIISLIGIASGLVVLGGMLSSRRLDGWTALFLTTTVLTSITGFFFPFERLLPSHIVGILSMIVLILAIVARYLRVLSGSWRWIYVTTALTALYFNVFVAVVQAFLKIPSLKSPAPQQNEPQFLVSQLVVLVAFLALGLKAARSFHPGSIRTAAA